MILAILLIVVLSGLSGVQISGEVIATGASFTSPTMNTYLMKVIFVGVSLGGTLGKFYFPGTFRNIDQGHNQNFCSRFKPIVISKSERRHCQLRILSFWPWIWSTQLALWLRSNFSISLNFHVWLRHLLVHSWIKQQ